MTELEKYLIPKLEAKGFKTQRAFCKELFDEYQINLSPSLFNQWIKKRRSLPLHFKEYVIKKLELDVEELDLAESTDEYKAEVLKETRKRNELLRKYLNKNINNFSDIEYRKEYLELTFARVLDINLIPTYCAAQSEENIGEELPDHYLLQRSFEFEIEDASTAWINWSEPVSFVIKVSEKSFLANSEFANPDKLYYLGIYYYDSSKFVPTKPEQHKFYMYKETLNNTIGFGYFREIEHDPMDYHNYIIKPTKLSVNYSNQKLYAVYQDKESFKCNYYSTEDIELLGEVRGKYEVC
ncbi:MAG TPA: hypothetical protein DCS13_03975 [Candidatus Margulisbacteria bacterium]|nr:hypothetical protein [Candidatus Margulisiibacteriota bacterium]